MMNDHRVSDRRRFVNPRCGSGAIVVQRLERLARCMQVMMVAVVPVGGLVVAVPAGLAQISDHHPLSDQLLAQQVIDGLPPPPLQPYGQPALSPDPQVNSSGVDPSATSPVERRFVVVVYGDSPLLLSQVQQVEPLASLQPMDGRTVIQAGVYDQQAAAEQQSARLAGQGIASAVVSVPGDALIASGLPYEPSAASADLPVTAVPQEIVFGQTPTFETAQPYDASLAYAAPTEASSRLFYVVIPGRSSELSGISTQVVRLGYGFGLSQVTEERGEPLGPHVRVGPFRDRNAAERWTRYFHDFGMNARVYYGR